MHRPTIRSIFTDENFNNFLFTILLFSPRITFTAFARMPQSQRLTMMHVSFVPFWDNNRNFNFPPCESHSRFDFDEDVKDGKKDSVLVPGTRNAFITT